ncbi:unnamed protein product [Moneuplotes crassus]|uniref:Uncharacterized protein n=1 Tax=Euplotes crassus TaxID=5936 RepID=A0AAD1U811_EUPCR|nr:unnamed protein product [Moneuplotes crassus]
MNISRSKSQPGDKFTSKIHANITSKSRYNINQNLQNNYATKKDLKELKKKNIVLAKADVLRKKQIKAAIKELAKANKEMIEFQKSRKNNPSAKKLNILAISEKLKLKLKKESDREVEIKKNIKIRALQKMLNTNETDLAKLETMHDQKVDSEHEKSKLLTDEVTIMTEKPKVSEVGTETDIGYNNLLRPVRADRLRSSDSLPKLIQQSVQYDSVEGLENETPFSYSKGFQALEEIGEEHLQEYYSLCSLIRDETPDDKIMSLKYNEHQNRFKNHKKLNFKPNDVFNLTKSIQNSEQKMKTKKLKCKILKEINQNYSKIMSFSKNRTVKRFQASILKVSSVKPKFKHKNKQTMTQPDMLSLLNKLKDYLLKGKIIENKLQENNSFEVVRKTSILETKCDKKSRKTNLSRKQRREIEKRLIMIDRISKSCSNSISHPPHSKPPSLHPPPTTSADAPDTFSSYQKIPLLPSIPLPNPSSHPYHPLPPPLSNVTPSLTYSPSQISFRLLPSLSQSPKRSTLPVTTGRVLQSGDK